MILDINLIGQPKLWDTPPIPDRLSCKFQIIVDEQMDVVCKALQEYQMWEGWETVLVLDILKNGDNSKSVIDFGSHIGWYSMIAAANGYSVFCYDESAESIKMLKESAALNRFGNLVMTCISRVDESRNSIPQSPKDVLLFKSDIEGKDMYAVKHYFHFFKTQKIDYALIEISPCFCHGYIEMVELIAGCGYDVYLIPNKGFDKRIEFGAYPLQTLKEHCLISDNYKDIINKIRQENFLFIKK